MARPIEYDKNEVLSKAMETFWHLGYESTSMKDLVLATGLTTRSMYNIFESKNGLFKASLEWYNQTVAQKGLDVLRQGQGYESVKDFLMMTSGGMSASNGCLFTNTQSDRYTIEDKSMSFVDDYFEELETVLIEKLTYARDHEGYEFDPKIKAKFIVIFVQGISVYSKKFKSSEEQRKVLENAVSMI